MCMVHLFYRRIHACFDVKRAFYFCKCVLHSCHMHVLFKLWVICTVARNILHMCIRCSRFTCHYLAKFL